MTTAAKPVYNVIEWHAVSKKIACHGYGVVTDRDLDIILDFEGESVVHEVRKKRYLALQQGPRLTPEREVQKELDAQRTAAQRPTVTAKPASKTWVIANRILNIAEPFTKKLSNVPASGSMRGKSADALRRLEGAYERFKDSPADLLESDILAFGEFSPRTALYLRRLTACRKDIATFYDTMAAENHPASPVLLRMVESITEIVVNTVPNIVALARTAHLADRLEALELRMNVQETPDGWNKAWNPNG